MRRSRVSSLFRMVGIAKTLVWAELSEALVDHLPVAPSLIPFPATVLHSSSLGLKFLVKSLPDGILMHDIPVNDLYFEVQHDH